MKTKEKPSGPTEGFTHYDIGCRFEELARLSISKYKDIKYEEAENLGVEIEILDSAVIQIRKNQDTEVEPPLAWINKYKPTDNDMEKLNSAEFLIDGIIPRGQLTVVCSEANVGKTTIFFHLAGEMTNKVQHVIYVNADASPDQAKEYHDKSKELRIELLLPDFSGDGMHGVVDNLYKTVQEGHDLTEYVFIFDTLKKMTEMINKSSVSKTMGLFRQLTGRGATVIALAHVNKHPTNGQIIFEGTGDIKNDCDNMIYLEADQKELPKVVSTRWDKCRAILINQTFTIDEERNVTRKDEYQNTSIKAKQSQEYKDDKDDILAIREAITKGKCSQSNIVKYTKEQGISRNTCLKILKRYAIGDFQQWIRSESQEKGNAVRYDLVPPSEYGTSRTS